MSNKIPGGAFAPPSGSAHAGPRLRCSEQSEHVFYGTYKGHTVAIERDGRGSPWSFRVMHPSGVYCADGVMREKTTKREAILFALRGAQLWPNEVDERTAQKQKDEVVK